MRDKGTQKDTAKIWLQDLDRPYSYVKHINFLGAEKNIDQWSMASYMYYSMCIFRHRGIRSHSFDEAHLGKHSSTPVGQGEVVVLLREGTRLPDGAKGESQWHDDP